MGNTIGVDAAKLAGLQIDLLQKIRSGHVSLDHLEWFNKLTREERDYLCGGKYAVGKPHITPIDRTTPFDPVQFLGKGWTIYEQGELSLELTGVGIHSIKLEHMLKPGEDWIDGEERLRRLKEARYLQLDAKVFQTLWENKESIPESWKKRIGTLATFVFFDGTILQDPRGLHHVIYLYWSRLRWNWNLDLVGGNRQAYTPSAVLVPRQS